MSKFESDLFKYHEFFSDEFVTNANCDVENVPFAFGIEMVSLWMFNTLISNFSYITPCVRYFL